MLSAPMIVTYASYTLISVTTIAVNSLSIYVIAQTRRLRERACNIFFLNLALADTLVALDVGVAVNLFMLTFPFGGNDIGCKLERITYLFFLQASVLFTLAISFDRFAFIRWPFLYRKHVTPRASWRLVGFVWFVSLVEGCSLCLSPTFYQAYNCEEFIASHFVHIIGHVVYLSIAICFMLSVYFYFSLLRIVRHQTRKHSVQSLTVGTKLSTLEKNPVGSLRTLARVHENPEKESEVRREADDGNEIIMDSMLHGGRTKIGDAKKEEDRCKKCFSEDQAVENSGASHSKKVDLILVSHLNFRQQRRELEATFDTRIMATSQAPFRCENRLDYGVAKSQAATLRKDRHTNDDDADTAALPHCTCGLLDVVQNSRSSFTPEGSSFHYSTSPGGPYRAKTYSSLPCSKMKETKRRPALAPVKDTIQFTTFLDAQGIATTSDDNNTQSTSFISEINSEPCKDNKHNLVIDNTYEVSVTFRETSRTEHQNSKCMDTEDIHSNSMPPTNVRTCHTTSESLNCTWSVSSHQCNDQVSANHSLEGASHMKGRYFHKACFQNRPSSLQDSASSMDASISNSPDSEMGAASLQSMRCCFHSFDNIRAKEPSTFVFRADGETSRSMCGSRCSCGDSDSDCQRKRTEDTDVSDTIPSSLSETRRSNGGAKETTKMRHESAKRKASKAERTHRVSKDIRAARRLFVMFGVFVVCWMPCIIIHFVIHNLHLPPFIEHIVVLIGLSNSVFNFFVYPLSTKTFRSAMRKTVPLCKKVIPENWEI